MTLNASGPISLAGSTAGQSIAVELGLSATGTISLNTASVRTLAGVASGAIIMPTNFYGKSDRVSVSFTYSANTQQASLNLSALGGYSSGKSDITVTVNSAIYLWSDSTGTPALNITGGTTGDTLTIVNNGYIMGKGGTGGSNSTGSVGGPAINFGFGLAGATINNTNGSAYIGGGGGGGGGRSGSTPNIHAAGGGAGGGAGGTGNTSEGPSPGGDGGAIGASGSNGTESFGGGGGGRIFPGAASSTSGFLSQGGQAGGRGSNNNGGGGGGGGSNNVGSNANTGFGAGGGGGWGASGGSSGGGNPGGSGGKAVNLNGKTVTFTSGNTTRVWGTVS